MNLKKRILSLCLAASLTACLFAGCGSKGSDSQPDCPFSELKWSSSVKDMEKAEGTDYETYDSVYGGTTYTYPKEFKGSAGTVKYMFDDKDRLAGIAWAYGSEDADEVYGLYDDIHKDLVDTYGDSGYNTDKETNYGDVWYRSEGNIIISTMVTNSQKALQYSYLSPEQSTDAADKYSSDKPDLIQ